MVTFGGWVGGRVNSLKGDLALTLKRGRRRTKAHEQIGVVEALLQGLGFADKWSR